MEAKMIKLNVPYKSQLDNLFNPYGACNVTSVAMVIEFINPAVMLDVPNINKTVQLEDVIYEEMEGLGLNRHVPSDLVKIMKVFNTKSVFKVNATIEEVVKHLNSELPCIIHGYFTSFGHIVVVVGYDDTGLIVHDPYGEWFPDGYDTTASGAYLHYSYDLIRRACAYDGEFWVHFIDGLNDE
ncbi:MULTISPECIES: C39 family peptidase [unclassified Microcoleus]|uniref:C39 family peptidase n=1 Tax=unclassified Microcoleus TaxID=2642155 RepID=UPI002FD5B519